MSNHNLGERLEKIKKFCMRKLPYIHSQGLFRYYTVHSVGHSEAVIKILDKLTEGVNLSEYENFLLKCSAWLHDIGMLMREGEDINNPVSIHLTTSVSIANPLNNCRFFFIT